MDQLTELLSDPEYPLHAGLRLTLRELALSSYRDDTYALVVADACDEDGCPQLGYALRWAARFRKRPVPPAGRISFMPGANIVNRWRWFDPSRPGAREPEKAGVVPLPVYPLLKAATRHKWQVREGHLAWMQAHQAWAALAVALSIGREYFPTRESLVGVRGGPGVNL